MNGRFPCSGLQNHRKIIRTLFSHCLNSIVTRCSIFLCVCHQHIPSEHIKEYILTNVIPLTCKTSAWHFIFKSVISLVTEMFMQSFTVIKCWTPTRFLFISATTVTLKWHITATSLFVAMATSTGYLLPYSKRHAPSMSTTSHLIGRTALWNSGG